MKASLDTNVLIHLYRANKQKILFEFFEEGVFIYEQIRNVELEHHGQDVLDRIDKDIYFGEIEVYTDDKLKKMGVDKIFHINVTENKYLYGSGDMGEVYAISLAQTLGAYSLVTDDVKQGGPYMSLLQFVDNDIIPFTFADILLIRFLAGYESAVDTVRIFDEINAVSDLKWTLKSQLGKFVKRFWLDVYQEKEKAWIEDYCARNHIKKKPKLEELKKVLNSKE